MPLGGTLAAFLAMLHARAQEAGQRRALDTMLSAMSQDDSQRRDGWAKLDVDDRVMNMFMRAVQMDIAKIALLELRKFTTVDQIPDGFGNQIVRKYVARVISGGYRSEKLIQS